MDYSAYNDYEILYMIHEGCEPALRFMIKKYRHLIYETARMFYPSGSKLQDLVQEGYMILYSCIRKYQMPSTATFYSYFLISLRRRYATVLRDDYFEELPRFEEKILYGRDAHEDLSRSIVPMLTDSEKEMVDFLILRERTFTEYGHLHDMSLAQVRYRYAKLMEKIKKNL